ncbi:hypothetical protein GF415_02525 [Candidatus Micrarchaeota archaeon]|nr:hypothetical protein [Candidatus Micrarchaeota archaeon]
MPPRRKRATRPSRPPKSLVKQQEKAFGRLMKAYRNALDKIAGERKEKTEGMIEEMRGLFEPGGYGPRGIREGLAACALSAMVCLGKNGADRFLEELDKRIQRLFGDEEIRNALIYARHGEEMADTRQNTILGYRERTKSLWEKYQMIEELDKLRAGEGEKEYGVLYAEPLQDGEFPVPVLVARQMHVKYFGIRGELGKEEKLETGKALEMVHYPIAETLGMTAETIGEIGRVATETILELGNYKGMENDRELYKKCQEYRAEILPFAERAQKILLGGRRSIHGSLRRTEKRYSWKLSLESQTIDPEECSRVKSSSRMFRKIKEKRKSGEEKFGLEHITDILGITVVVDKTKKNPREPQSKDALVAASALAMDLGNAYRGKIKLEELKYGKRRTGYRAPHLKIKMLVGEKGEEREIPVEIQVRTRELQEECTKGRLSRGKKVGNVITDAIVEAMSRRIEELANNVEASITRNSWTGLEENGRKERVARVEVVERRKGRREISKKQAVITRPGECVAGVIALIEYKEGREHHFVGFEEYATAKDKEGNPLAIFDRAPSHVFVELGGKESTGINRPTCTALIGKITTPEALEMLRARIKYLKSVERRKNGRKK